MTRLICSLPGSGLHGLDPGRRQRRRAVWVLNASAFGGAAAGSAPDGEDGGR